jgi:hypothetical protein
MGVFQNNLLAGAAAAASAGGAGFYDYQIEQSARFDKASSSTLKFDVTSAGDRTAWAFSTWFKFGLLNSADSGSNGYSTIFGSGRSGQYDYIAFYKTNHHIYWQDYLGASTPDYGITNASFRDTGGWYHLVWIWDSDDSTQADRVRVYINGNRITDYSASALPDSGAESDINNSGRDFVIGDSAVGDGKLFDGYLAETMFIDGGAEAFTAETFGETKNGVWIPKAYTGSFGSNGFHLKYENASDLGNDSSGNNNDFTVANMGADHQVLDSPTFGS